MLTNITTSLPPPAVSLSHRPARNLHRATDLMLTVLLLLPALPLMALVWALVRLTSAGPAFYTQRRAGLRGREFFIHKFRSMTWNCEQATGAVWAQRNDPRVTRIGKFLRKSHLDELPQLFDVLHGDMSLVGPRPERPEIIQRLLPEIPNYLHRLEVRPGVTGLAQIFCESDLTIDDVRRKVLFDHWYIARRSLWLDLRIVFCTGLKVLGLNKPSVREILFPTVCAQLNA